MMDRMQVAAIKKKSFELYYHDGTIWCEHLDGMGPYEDEMITKFLEDKQTFSRPSVSSFMIINLDKTHMTDRIADTIVTAIIESDKPFRKIVFVGVKAPWRGRFGTIKQKGIMINFIDDYEKAKEWLI